MDISCSIQQWMWSKGRGLISPCSIHHQCTVLYTVLLTNYFLATALPINGVTQKELSAEYQIFSTPAGYVFAIWGIIYLGLTAYITVQFPMADFQSDWTFLVVSCVCNATWLMIWHYRYLSISLC